jgi:hypothetical protein
MSGMPDPGVDPLIQSCDIEPGTILWEPCPTCRHIIAVHTHPDAICSVCQLIAELRESSDG